jgi:hypothetical protein
MSNLLEQASLVMIPSGYKEDIVYSEIPIDGSGDLQLTRASNGTRVNSAGLVEVCPWNLVTYSSVLSDSSYTISELSRTNSQTDPNGGSTGALFTATSATNAYILKSFSTIIGQSYTIFVYLKGNSSGSVSIRVDGAGTAPVNNVNYTTSYQQFTYTFTADSTTSTIIIGGYNTWLGTEAIYVAFPQANLGSTAKPYFPTTDRLNVPRLTYQNGGGGCPSLLLEKQSTNLVSYSEQFDNAYWSKNNSTITANNTTSPDGTQNADRLTENTTSNVQHWVTRGGITIASNTKITASVFVKFDSANRRAFLQINDGTNFAGVILAQDGSVAAQDTGFSNRSFSAVAIGNGWYRLNMSLTTSTTTGITIRIIIIQGTVTQSYTGDGTSGFYIWGAQLEASSYPTSYIPTTSSSATRVADACFKTGISSLIGQTEGVIFCDFINVPNLSFSDVLSIGAIATGLIELQTSGGSTINAVYYNGGALANIPALSTMTIGQRYKAAFAYKTNDFVFYLNGVQQGTDTSGTVTSGMAEISLNGYGSSTSNNENATINQVALFKTRLTNAELAALTTI